MKLTLLSTLFVAFSFSALSQHNYLITSPTSSSTFIRDAVVVDDQTLLCALDLRIEKKRETGIAQMNSSGEAYWAKQIVITGSQEHYGYDVIAHENGSYYAHGLVLVDFLQYAYIWKISKEGSLENSTFFDLGKADFCGINKMKVLKDGDMICSFTHMDGVSFIRLKPSGHLVWGTTIEREINGTGKQPGYDFHVLEDESIVACGPNNGHFGILSISKNGRILSDDNISMGTFSQAKTMKVLPSGNLFITGDYLRDGNYATFIMTI